MCRSIAVLFLSGVFLYSSSAHAAAGPFDVRTTSDPADPSVVAATTFGGPDQLVFTSDYMAHWWQQGISMDIAGLTSEASLHGTIFVAVEAESILTFRRSTDGGDTWGTWAQFEGSQPSLHIAEGDEDWLFVGYMHGDSIYVGRAAMDTDAPVFEHVAVMGASSFARPDLVSDSDFNSSYTLYVVAAGVDGNGNDVWFSRSTDFGASFDPPYKIADLSNTYDANSPNIDADMQGNVHCVWSLWGPAETSVRYRRAVNKAALGLADWEPVVALTDTMDGFHERFPCVAASRDSAHVLVAFEKVVTSSGPAQNGRVRLGRDHGATWDPVDEGELPSYLGRPVMLALPDGQGYVVANYRLSGKWLSRASVEDPLTWGPAEVFQDYDYGNDRTNLPHLAVDRSRENQVAVLWSHIPLGIFVTTADSVFFDAEWRELTTASAHAWGSADFLLEEPIPNPVRRTTRIAYRVPAEAMVHLDVYDIRGRRISSLVQRSLPEGRYEVTWNPLQRPSMRLASGVYLVRLHLQNASRSIVQQRKVILVQ